MAKCVLDKDEDFRILKTLGSGGFGCVYLIRHRTYGRIAYKELQKKLPTSAFGEEHLETLREEAKIQQNLKHPNIVVLYGAQFDANNCGLFLEFMKHGPVNEFIEMFDVTWGWKIQVMHDVGLAMFYLHCQQPAIIHGDLKCQNILIGNEYRAKITDFGLAQTIQSIPYQDGDGGHHRGGTTQYIAPECWTRPPGKKTKKFDVYSFAISMWEVFSQKTCLLQLCSRNNSCVCIERR